MTPRDADRLYRHIRWLYLAVFILATALTAVAILAATAAAQTSGRHATPRPVAVHPALAKPPTLRWLNLRVDDGRRTSRSKTRPPLPTPQPSPASGPTDRQWWQLRQCESGNNYQAISPSGTYRGAYQFDRSTWASYGPAGDPAAATKPEQDSRAERLYDARGAQPWPVCGRYLP